VGRKRVRRRKPKSQLRAKDFGDNPKIRRRYGEAEKVHMGEPWEVKYAKRKKKLARLLLEEEEEK
jgi:hypothetical protein